MVAASDSAGAVANPEGLDVAALGAWKAEGHTVGAFGGGEPIPRDELLGVDCDLLIPAARPDVLDAGNAERVRATVVLQGANLLTTVEAEQLLHKRGVLVVPDIIANAGGVICAAVETGAGPRPRRWPWSRRKSAPTPPKCWATRPSWESHPERRPRSWPAVGSPRPPATAEPGECGLPVTPSNLRRTRRHC